MNLTDRALIGQNILFNGMDFSEVEYILEGNAVRTLNADEILLRPDTPNQHLHLILDGGLSVHLVAEEKLEHPSLLAGECAGEISLVDGQLPSAVVVANQPTRILSISHDAVWSLIGNSHVIARNLLQILACRMRNNSVALIVSQNKKANFERQAYGDALTGVYNRHWMSNAFPRALDQCNLNKLPFAVMIVDIDHFKHVNDTYGHLVGDLALQVVSRCLQESLRPNDLLVRYGGEEFAVFLPDAELDVVQTIAERLRSKTEKIEICNDDVSFKVTISIGMTSTRYDDTIVNLIGDADKALYRAKQSGRNRVEVYDEA